jgi:hypothetical protein
MLSARWIPWSLVMLGCAPNDLEVLDGGAAFDSGARTDRAVIDAPRTDGPRADAAIAMDAAPATDATASDATAPDAAATDGPRADGGPADARAACTVTPSAEPFRSPALRLHWRATAGALRGRRPGVLDPRRGRHRARARREERVPEVAFMTFDCEASYARSVLRVISGRAPYTGCGGRRTASARPTPRARPPPCAGTATPRSATSTATRPTGWRSSR